MDGRGHPERSALRLRRVISGGQTGVDRAALSAAVEAGLEHGGWCPRGRRAEDGRIPAEFALQETESRAYDVRTQRNVEDSDGTLILHRGPLQGGTALTSRIAQQQKKPLFCVDLSEPQMDLSAVRQWLADHQIETLNVAGPRESSSPGVYEAARALLRELFGAGEE